jgi:hypothetical protein
MSHERPYYVMRPAPGSRQVQAWSGYPLQFGGQRRFPWQDQMAADLRAALAGLSVAAGDVLAGEYLSTDTSRCDVENRLFTNPGAACFPKGVSSIRFERGVDPPPPPPVPVASTEGHLYYYRYHLGGTWQWWEPAAPLARWHRVTRHLPDDGSGRPVWLAMKQAAAVGGIEILDSLLDDAHPFGVRIVVHATPRGPRQATTISESIIDGTIAAFHTATSTSAAAAVAAALAPHMPGMTVADIQALATASSPGPLFPTSPFVVRHSRIQISPCDERCYAGQVTIQRDAQGQFPQISGELFTLHPATPPSPGTQDAGQRDESR